jgi:ubiquinone/menaquinone biosynthesis C-methylase UbiE
MTYDFVAGFYDGLEMIAAGGTMQRCRRAFLGETLNCRDVLLLGEGTGRFLVDLLKSNPKARITYLDSSARMHLLAKKRLARCLPGHANIQFVQADILEENLVGNESFDLVVANFFFDCFSPASVDQLVRTISLLMKPKAIWLISDFDYPGAGLGGVRAAFVLKCLYLFFGSLTRLEARFLTLPDAALRRNGFLPLKQMRSDWGLFRSTVWVLGS